jgi:hypothetical protein
MKVRNGFVSNSSTSSFCLFGIALGGTDDLEKMGMIFTDRDDPYDEIYKLVQDSGLDIVFDNDNDVIYVGLHPDCMGLDETKRQFQARVRELMTKLLPDSVSEKLEIHEGEIFS